MIVVYILLIALYAALIYCFFAFLAKPVLLLGSAFMIVLVCMRYFQALGENLFWGDGAPDRIAGKEPGFYNYFFDKAWRDCLCIAQRARDLMLRDARRLIGWGRALMNPLGWFLGIALWAIAAVTAIPALVVVALCGLIHLLIVALFTILTYLSAVLLRLVEFVNMALRRIRGRCPNCHRYISLPEYVCQCAATHKRLIPGPYGPILRRCRCNRELPTLFLFGRNKLHSICPHCGDVLNTTMLTVGEIFVPIVGGVSSGKSSVMTATLVEFEKKESGLSVSFPKAHDKNESADQRNYNRSRAQYSSGQMMEKTTDREVRAFQVSLEDARKHKRLLYAYDAAGEIHHGEHGLGSLPYYSHIHGLIFLVDPFSLAADSIGSSGLHNDAASLSHSTDAPQDVYDQVVRSLISYSGRKSIQSVPLAILVTKTDACNIRSRILKTPITPAPRKKPYTAQELSSLTVREWLFKNGGASLVQSAEQYFRNVQYFECSALGRIPGTNTDSFQARGILEPWAWILQESGLTVQIPTKGNLA